MLQKIIEWLNRNPCAECDYYNTPNNPKGWCQSKKVCNNGHGKVTKIDRLFCEPCKDAYKRKGKGIMGYGWDEEDVGGYLAEQDSYIEDCEFYDGKCGKCPNKYSCQNSDFNQRREYRWQ